MCSQVPVGASARDRELPSATSLPAKVNLGLVLGEAAEGHANQVASTAAASEGNASLGEPEDDGIHSHYSHSPASSQCSATYSNLGKSEIWKMDREGFLFCFFKLMFILVLEKPEI